MQQTMAFKTFRILAKAAMASQSSEPFSGKSSQPLVGSPHGCPQILIRAGRILFGLPALDEAANVALENFGQVVVAIEFILVRDACKALDGLCNSHDQFLILSVFSGLPLPALE
jgi:hypothetical protein